MPARRAAASAEYHQQRRQMFAIFPISFFMCSHLVTPTEATLSSSLVVAVNIPKRTTLYKMYASAVRA